MWILFKKILLLLTFVPIVLVGMVGISMMVSLYYSVRFSNDGVFFINSPLSLFPIVFIVSVIILLLFKIERPSNAKLEQKVVLIAMVIGFFLGILSLFTFNKFTLDGITSYSLLGNKEYAFSEVSLYTVSESSDGTLKIEFKMNDQKNYVFIGGVLNAVSYESANISDIYSEDPYAEYIFYTAEIMKKNQVKSNIISEAEIEELDYDYWIDIAKNIQKIYNE